ncbi:MAG: hypothetical protein ABSB40_04930 [Nitrososphaeria archaeon]
MYKCHACGNLYESPVIDYHCQKCGEYFPIEELGETVVYQYEVVNHKMEMIKNSLKTLENLEKTLKEKNYLVKRAAQVTGTSGIAFDVDLYATNSEKQDNILAATYLLESNITVDEILRLQALGYDLNSKKIIMVTYSTFDQKAEFLANYYNIKMVVPENTGEINEEQAIKLFL